MILRFAVALQLVLLSSIAHADEVPTTTPEVAAPKRPKPPGPEDAAVRFPRLQWGMSIEGGPYFYNGYDGGVGGLSGRIGVQFTPRFAMYAQGVSLVGGGVTIFESDTTTTIATEVIATQMFSAIAEVDFLKWFYAGLGTEVVFAAAAGPVPASGAFFGITTRAGLWTSDSEAPRAAHKGFQLGIDLHALITPNGVLVIPMLALGYEAF